MIRFRFLLLIFCVGLVFSRCDFFYPSYYIDIKVTFKSADQGEAEVYLDGEFIDTYNKNRTQVTLGKYEPGDHWITLEITKSGTLDEFWVKWAQDDEFIRYTIERWNDLGAVSEGDTISKTFSIPH